MKMVGRAEGFRWEILEVNKNGGPECGRKHQNCPRTDEKAEEDWVDEMWMRMRIQMRMPVLMLLLVVVVVVAAAVAAGGDGGECG